MPIFQKRKAHNFASDRPIDGENEKGSMTIFGLSMSVGIVAAGGITLDSMYFESRRIAAQDALDRCSVMAALAQNRFDGSATGNETAEQQVAKAKQVAQDCMSKSSAGSEGLATAISTANSTRSATLSGNYTFASRRNSDDTETFTMSSTATQKLPNIELTIAIDISHYAFWQGAREPIKKFINTVTAPDTGGKVTVNIIPFGKSVNLGTAVLNQFNMANQPPFSTLENRSCLLLPESNKDKIEIDLNYNYNWAWPLELERNNRTSPKTVEMYVEEYTQDLLGANTTSKEHLRYTGEVEKLITPAYIKSKEVSTYKPTGNCQFMPEGNSVLLGASAGSSGSTTTSDVVKKLDEIESYYKMIDYAGSHYDDGNAAEGMKWALASMDPSMRDIFEVLNGTNEASGDNYRPLDYNSANSLKLLLFIPNSIFNLANGSFGAEGDASSTNLPTRVREIRPEFLDDSKPDPDIWRTPIPETFNQGYRYSIRFDNAPDPTKPYWTTPSTYSAFPASSTESWLEKQAHWTAAPFQFPGGPAPVQQSWRDIFEKMSVDYLISALYQAPMHNAGILPNDSNYSYAKLANDFTYIATNSATAMSNFTALCQKAKDNGVIIYTLLGDGTANNDVATLAAEARTKYQNCATSAAHSFNVTRLNVVGQEYSRLKSSLRLISSSIAQLSLTQ